MNDQILAELKTLRRQIEELRAMPMPRLVTLNPPLTSTSYDGDDTVAVGTNSVDMSAVFGVPVGVKGLLLWVVADWVAQSAASMLSVRPKGGSVDYGWLNAHDTFDQETLIFTACDSNSDIDLVVANANATNVIIRVLGYWV